MTRIDQRFRRAETIVFHKTREAYGGLSNMAGGYPLRVQGVRILTSEALYQACRFPHLVDVQQLIMAQASPMTAKMKSKPHRARSREDWDAVRVDIMRWCIKVKLAQHRVQFGNLLLGTSDKTIVEQSRKDRFWGAVPEPDGETLVGENVLGQLLVEVRDQLRSNPSAFDQIMPPQIVNFTLLGQTIGKVETG
jgi:ribA/ribD-fused uncharacterized protein